MEKKQITPEIENGIKSAMDELLELIYLILNVNTCELIDLDWDFGAPSARRSDQGHFTALGLVRSLRSGVASPGSSP